MKFIDNAEIKIKAGDGGNGMAHFRRDRFVPFGGPDGGNGGEGGNVFIQASHNLSTLLDYRYKRFHQAENGGNGGTNNRAGRCGEDLILKVPCGTEVYDTETQQKIGEVLTNEDKLLICKGGRGGTGNSCFATSRNQAPTKTLPPEPGQSRGIRLELKMLADVGIIGAPNAGKSTLVTVISAAQPKIADYPFTTLVPTLGVVSHKDAAPFVVADVPGLIPGAHTGKGLGIDFLKHIERTKILVHLVDGSQGDFEAMKTDFESIIEELSFYKAELLTRPRLTVISKLDFKDTDPIDDFTAGQKDALEDFKKYLQGKGIEPFEISSAMRMGIPKLLDVLVEKLGQDQE